MAATDPNLTWFRRAIQELYGTRVERVVLYGARAAIRTPRAITISQCFCETFPAAGKRYGALPISSFRFSMKRALQYTRCLTQRKAGETPPRRLCMKSAKTAPICETGNCRLSCERRSSAYERQGKAKDQLSSAPASSLGPSLGNKVEKRGHSGPSASHWRESFAIVQPNERFLPTGRSGTALA